MSISVSVAMATYQGGRFLSEQLDSLARQTLLPRELVICDDLSSDSTEEVVEAFAERAPFPVTFVRNADRLHFADNFLKAAGLTRGDFVAFCDQDDVWLPRKLEKVVGTIEATGAVLVSHDALTIDEEGDRLGRFGHSQPLGSVSAHDMVPWHFFFGFSITFDRRLLELAAAKCRPRDLVDPRFLMAHDRWICFLATAAGPVVHLPDGLVLYRQHADNASGWMRRRRTGRWTSVREKFGVHLHKQLVIGGALIDILQSLPSRDGVASEELLVARYLWRQHLHSWALRSRIAETDGRLRRCRALWLAAARGAYRRPGRGRTDMRFLGQDLVAAVVARRGQSALATRHWPSITGEHHR